MWPHVVLNGSGCQVARGRYMTQGTIDRNVVIIDMPKHIPDDVRELIEVANQFCEASVRGAARELRLLLRERPDLQRQQPLHLVWPEDR